jgi:hypothetical protein
MSQQNPNSQSEWEQPPDSDAIAAAIESEWCGDCLSGPADCDRMDAAMVPNEDGGEEVICRRYADKDGE